MPETMFWIGVALLSIGFVGLASPSTREKGERWSPGWVLFGALCMAVHAYNYARIVGA